MSSGGGGKFQDHYALFGIEPNADSDTIQAVYSRLAQKYHPSNPETGDKTKFDAVNQAYEVLSDAALRAAFDQVKGIDHDAGSPKFTGAEFFLALEDGAALRSAILCILYDRRRLKALKPSLPLRQMEGMLQVTLDEMNFALWYLKQRGLVVNDDKSSMAITVEGMDYLEKNMPPVEAVVKFIKREALVDPGVRPAAPVSEARSGEPVLNALNRALLRHSPSGETQPRAEETQPRVALRPK
jgi:hypothetical protein